MTLSGVTVTWSVGTVLSCCKVWESVCRVFLFRLPQGCWPFYRHWLGEGPSEKDPRHCRSTAHHLQVSAPRLPGVWILGFPPFWKLLLPSPTPPNKESLRHAIYKCGLLACRKFFLKNLAILCMHSHVLPASWLGWKRSECCSAPMGLIETCLK